MNQIVRATEDARLVEMLRDYSAQAGWLQEQVISDRKAMADSLIILRRSRSVEARAAVLALEFQLRGIDRSLALINAADAASKAEREAARALQ